MVRKSLNLTQKKIADSVDLSTSYISELESGKQKSCSMLYHHLATAHHVNINFILTGRGGMFEEGLDFRNFDQKDKERIKAMLKMMNEKESVFYRVMGEFSEIKESAKE